MSSQIVPLKENFLLMTSLERNVMQVCCQFMCKSHISRTMRKQCRVIKHGKMITSSNYTFRLHEWYKLHYSSQKKKICKHLTYFSKSHSLKSLASRREEGCGWSGTYLTSSRKSRWLWLPSMLDSETKTRTTTMLLLLHKHSSRVHKQTDKTRGRRSVCKRSRAR